MLLKEKKTRKQCVELLIKTWNEIPFQWNVYIHFLRKGYLYSQSNLSFCFVKIHSKVEFCKPPTQIQDLILVKNKSIDESTAIA